MKLRCALVAAVSLGWGCTPGKLSDDEKRAFQRELERRYPAEDDTNTDSTETEPDAGGESGSEEDTEDEAPDAGPEEETEPTEPDPPEPGLVFAPCVLEVFSTGCAGALCHYEAIAAFPPDMERPDLAEYLVTQQPTCRDVETYIDLDQPDQSLLLLKVLGEQPASCGTPMPPPGAPELSPAQLQCLVDWFDSL